MGFAYSGIDQSAISDFVGGSKMLKTTRMTQISKVDEQAIFSNGFLDFLSDLLLMMWCGAWVAM